MVKLVFIDVIAAYISTFMLRDHFSHESRCNIIQISALKDDRCLRVQRQVFLKNTDLWAFLQKMKRGEKASPLLLNIFQIQYFNRNIKWKTSYEYSCRTHFKMFLNHGRPCKQPCSSGLTTKLQWPFTAVRYNDIYHKTI